jgi:lipoprotein-anchoring transpeptidase ErfK/SrfK
MHLRRRTVVTTVTLAGAALVLAGAHVASADGTARTSASSPVKAAVAAAVAPVALTVDAAPGKNGRRGLAKPLIVTVTGGTLTSVVGTVTPIGLHVGARSVPLAGTAGPTGTTWASSALQPARTYRLTAVATSPDGTKVTKSATVRSAKPAKKLSATITPGRGADVGVGMPIIVNLSRSVPSKAGKAAVQSALKVTANKPIGVGAWGWVTDSQLQFRPRHFWPGHTKVKVKAALAGVFAGRKGGWAVEDTSTRFTVGRSQVMTVSGVSHSFVIKRNGKVVRSGGVSLGKSGFTTRSGIKVIMTREVSHRMKSSTVGIPDGSADSYDLDVPYAMRVTNSGEFVHGAPWNHQIGFANASHGCTNLTLTNAIWLYHNSMIGDPVVTSGTGRASELGNGLGGAWNLKWKSWKALSAVPV